jgi:hypothetical protein
MKTLITSLLLFAGSMAYSQSAQLFVDNWGDTTKQYVYRADGGLDYKVEYFGSYRKVTGYHMTEWFQQSDITEKIERMELGNFMTLWVK